MEIHDDEIDNHDTTASCTSATTWTVAGGSLANCVSFESSLSPINDETPKTPASSLILHPPSPDSGPCEITVNFTQKHEVQQVYVRSTARVYEIYYAPDMQSGNEYLCTVRCGIAARDEDMLHTGDNEGVRSANSNGSNGLLKDPSEDKSRNGNSLNNSEDDWVEVKVSETNVLDNKVNSLQLKLQSAQEFYEATAQISDASPCVSLTLRLLSLERKDCVCVGEVYVFADPVDTSDSENQVSTVENSAGSSLMAMLVPTLLQFSKTRGANRTQDKPISDTWGKQNSLVIGSKETDSISVATKIQEQGKASIPDHQEVKVPDVNRATTSTAQLCIPSQVESSVHQLYSRMGRIEDLFLRFEEKMLKPISSIEARLERVEQQLEVLVNKSHNSGLPTCSRFYASSFSCNESESNSFYNNGNDYPRSEAFESGKKDIQSDAPLTIPNDTSASVYSTHLLPSLVVTAPEFSNGDDDEEEDEEDHTSDVVIGSAEKPRPALTIDDALASALAGFMSLTSTQPEKHAQTLLVKAPDFLNEADGSIERKESTRVEHEADIDSSMCLGEAGATENIKGSLADLTKNSSEGEGNVIKSPNDEETDKTLTVEGLDQHYEGGEGGKLDDDKSIDNAVDPANGGMSTTDFCQITEDIENGDISTEIRNILHPDNADVRNQLPQHQTDDGYDNTQEDANTDSDLTPPKEVTEEKSDKDALKNILNFSHAASVVDFDIPVLDVKFTSQDSCDNGYFSLEALLTELPESVTESPSVKKSDEVLPVGPDERDLILVDGEPVGPAPDGNFSVDMDFYSIGEPLSLWGDHTCNSHETFAASLI
ncbi:hypothetical protein D8674_021167 [Pyrus ussuriensis x Pyrus communis]|uniref:Uncharacterized protein n=1 Tax=Pyrus ussuriensis x Pyrus communis TaxID=2448454 RepID=A0A5N5HHU0_9ROSA|nr:hypothetical protein D8674_021167 [Pyrus ussuriensis x Pyrus communis]